MREYCFRMPNNDLGRTVFDRATAQGCHARDIGTSLSMVPAAVLRPLELSTAHATSLDVEAASWHALFGQRVKHTREKLYSGDTRRTCR